MVQQNQTYRVARKTATQTFTQSNTTLQNITSLKAGMDIGKTYKFKASIIVKGKADSDVKLAIIGPATGSPTGVYDLQGVVPGVVALGTAIATSLTDDVVSQIIIEGIVTCGTVAGDLQVQGAQNVSQADNCVVQIGSMLEVWQVSDTT